MDGDKRNSERRFQDLTAETSDDETQKVKVKRFPRNKATAYTAEMIRSRREWLAELTQTQLKHLAHFSEDPEDFKGKIESPIGVAHVPVGIAGPLRINGEHARGVFFIPMATTEGALITSYTFGSNIITRSGGVNVKILKDALTSDPTFVFKSSAQAQSFVTWIENNFGRIKEIAEKTSRHLCLIKVVPMINGRRVILCLHFQTGDALGMNMAYRATDVVCKMIRDSVDPEEFWPHSSFTTIKKTTAENFVNGYGKSAMADVTIPRKLVERLNTTPEQMERFFLRQLLGSAQGVLFGISAHIANAMTAIAIACGQDAALVANTHCANITCEATKNGDLYFSAYFPSVFAATVGGGTSFGTARECLETLGCYGDGKSKRFAEIIAATAIAGEIGLMISIVNGTYIHAHETFGRNRPPQ
jgi:hydroxymethylglutaryl-CoA reductase (NADPH)